MSARRGATGSRANRLSLPILRSGLVAAIIGVAALSAIGVGSPAGAFTGAASLSLATTSNPTTYSAAGTSIQLNYQVTNTGTTALYGIAVHDTLVHGVTCPPGPLVAKATVMCTVTYLTSQADVDRGSFTSSASATGKVEQSTFISNTATLVVNASGVTETLGLTKLSPQTGYAKAGDSITYIYVITNTGTASVGSLKITDNKVKAVKCAVLKLAPGGTDQCSGMYSVTQADVDAGSLTNTATAFGTAGTNPVSSNEAQLTLPASGATSSLSLTKSSSSSGFGKAGDPITYSYVVTNTGTTTISSIVVNDDHIAPVPCMAHHLAPGANTPCSAMYSVKKADVTAGSVTNHATATGLNPQQAQVTSNTAQVTVNLIGTSAGLSLVKATTSTGYAKAGDQINYTYSVTNTGTVALSSVVVNDDHVPAVSCPSSTLAAGASEMCNGMYQVTQADVDAGSVTNKATATALNPTSKTITSNTSSVTVSVSGFTSSLSLTKATTATGYNEAGVPLSYTYTVTNTGTTTISEISVTDNLIPSVSCPNSSLAPNASEVCTGMYTTAQGDVDGGSVTNTATANGTDPFSTAVASNQSSVTVDASGYTSTLTLTKATTTTGYSKAGDQIAYTYVVTNTGTTTIGDIGVTDNLVSPVTCPDSSLAPGAMETCNGTYLTTQADVDNGSVTNVATANGTADPLGSAVASNSSTVTVNASGTSSSLSLAKATTSTGYATAGDTIAYTYVVTNTGTTTISSIAVSDDHVATVSCPVATLAPNSADTCNGTYTVTQADVDAGSVTNQATATGKDPKNATVTSNSSTVTVAASGATSALTLAKSTNAAFFTGIGQSIVYSYLVTNTGTTTETSISVTDNLIPSVTCPHASLAPALHETCTGNYSITNHDITEGSVTNTATVSGKAPSGSTVTSSPSKVTLSYAPTNAYDLVGSDGGVFAFTVQGGGNGYFGSLPGMGISVNNIVGIVPTSDYQGYFLVGSDGGVFAFGDAPFENSLPGDKISVNNIVGIVPTADDQGYFLVGSDGGVFAFGDAPFENSLPGDNVSVNNISGIVPTGDDQGYWLVSTTGAVYSFGDASYLGGLGGASPTPIVGIARTADGHGYWLVGQNGAVYPYGDASSYGDLPQMNVSVNNIVSIVPTSTGKGYLLIGRDGGVFAFGDANNLGSIPGLNIFVDNIVGAAPVHD